MSWSWPPYFVHYFDGCAWVDGPTFENEAAAADFARATFPAVDIEDGLVTLVPVVDPAEGREAIR